MSVTERTIPRSKCQTVLSSFFIEQHLDHFIFVEDVEQIVTAQNKQFTGFRGDSFIETFHSLSHTRMLSSYPFYYMFIVNPVLYLLKARQQRITFRMSSFFIIHHEATVTLYKRSRHFDKRHFPTSFITSLCDKPKKTIDKLRQTKNR